MELPIYIKFHWSSWRLILLVKINTSYRYLYLLLYFKTKLIWRGFRFVNCLLYQRWCDIMIAMTIYWVLTICQILLSTLHKLSHLILETILWGLYYHLSFIFYLFKNFLALPHGLQDLRDPCRILQGWHLSGLQQKGRVPTTGPPGNSLSSPFYLR